MFIGVDNNNHIHVLRQTMILLPLHIRFYFILVKSYESVELFTIFCDNSVFIRMYLWSGKSSALKSRFSFLPATFSIFNLFFLSRSWHCDLFYLIFYKLNFRIAITSKLYTVLFLHYILFISQVIMYF